MKLLKLCLLAIIISGLFHTGALAEKIYVFAAASTTNAVSDICKKYSEKYNTQSITSFASSSTLARQIEMGAPASIYISANPKWMEYLDKKEMIEKGTRCDLLGNRIVLIVPLDSAFGKVDIKKGFGLIKMLNGERLSMGDPEHVPAGIYGKQALTYLCIWKELSSSVIRAKDVRTALVFVERGEAPFGVVYSTDAAISKKVKVAGFFPEESHPAITYQAGIVKGKRSKDVEAFFSFLKSRDSGAIFSRYGFKVK